MMAAALPRAMPCLWSCTARPSIAAGDLGGGVSGPRRSVERGRGPWGAGARRGPRPYASGAAAVLSRPQPLNGQPRRRRLRSPLPRSGARRRVRPRRAVGRCGTGRDAIGHNRPEWWYRVSLSASCAHRMTCGSRAIPIAAQRWLPRSPAVSTTRAASPARLRSAAAMASRASLASARACLAAAWACDSLARQRASHSRSIRSCVSARRSRCSACSPWW